MTKQTTTPDYYVVTVPPYPHIMEKDDAYNSLLHITQCLRAYNVQHPPLHSARRPLKGPAAGHVIRHALPRFFLTLNPICLRLLPLRPRNIRVQREYNGKYNLSIRVRDPKRWCPLMEVDRHYHITSVLYDLENTVVIRALYSELMRTDSPYSLRADIKRFAGMFRNLCHDVTGKTTNGHDVRCRVSEGLSRIADPIMRHLTRYTRHIHYIPSGTVTKVHLDRLSFFGGVRYTTLNPRLVEGSLREVDHTSRRAMQLVRSAQIKFSEGISCCEDTFAREIKDCRDAMLHMQRALSVADTAATAHRALDALEKILHQKRMTKATGAVLCRRT